MSIETQSQSLVSRSFKGIWIPKEIWLDKRLNYFEKCLLAEIYSLDDDEKGCYASNQYFMDFFDERERKIQEGLSKLKNLGFIIYEKFDGRIRTLRTNLYGDKSLFNTSGMSKSAPPSCGNPHPSPIGDFIEPDNKADSKAYKKNICPQQAASPPSPPSSAHEITSLLIEAIKKTKPDIKEPNFKAWEIEIEKLLRIDKRLLSTVKEVLEWLPTSSFWSKVVLSAEKFRFQFDKLELAMNEKPSKSYSDDLQLLKKLSERKDLIQRGIINPGPDYVEFPQIRDAYFKVREPGFKEKVLNTLRKCGVPIN